LTIGLSTSTNAAEVDDDFGVTAVGSDGFSVRENTSAQGQINTGTLVAWQWKAGTAASGDTVGLGTLKTFTASVSTDSGFSVTKYTGNGTNGHQFPHSLGVAPEMLIVKRTDTTGDWIVFHKSLGATKILELNDTAAEETSQTYWNNSAPNSTSMPLNTNVDVNADDGVYVAYSFVSKQGYSKVGGSYVGNGQADDGPFVYCGFRPAWLIVKRTDSADQWMIVDNKRDTYNEMTNVLRADATNAEESTPTAYAFDFLSNGFKLKDDDGKINADGGTYIYLAFAEAPFVNSNGVPCNAR
jgi:hypothetical protein